MKYRTLGSTGINVSEISLGCEHLEGKPQELVENVVNAALAGGVNFLDVFMAQPQIRDYIGAALAGRRKDVALQGHIGACWINGQYEVKRDYDNCRFYFDDLLTRYKTDYMDVGMFHNMDDPDEWKALLDSETLKYALDMKKSGVIKGLGISSHNPELAMDAVNSGLIDVLMFSLNPAFDIMPQDYSMMDFFNGKDMDIAKAKIVPIRAALYNACEEKGVAITVMKALGAGLLFRSENAILGAPMTVHQCLNYALTRPAVSAVMLGMQKVEEVQEALRYYDVSEEERDCVPVISKSNGFSLSGKCMYCNHCLPCAANIDIAALNRELDMVGDSLPSDTLKAHYFALDKTAKDCLRCGECMTRCPFSVDVIARMDKAERVFGG